MARRKKKNRSSEKPGQVTESLPAPGENSISSRPAPDKEPHNMAPARKAPRGLYVSTCVGGMFLTFILGLYLGTLMPGIVEDYFHAEKKSPFLAQADPGQTPENGSNSLSTAPPMRVVSEKPVPVETKSAPAPTVPSDMASRITELTGIVAKNPENLAALVELGNLYFDTNQPKKSIAAYERALAISPANADVLTDLGIMYREDGNFPKALESFQKAIQVNPAHENAMFNEGVVLYHDLGRKAEARAAWGRLVGINPEARAPDGKPVSEMINNLK